MKNEWLKRYIMDPAPSYAQDLVPNQIQQTWIRLASCALGTIYVLMHAPMLQSYLFILLGMGGTYVAWQIYTLLNTPKKPLSFSRMVIAPILDAAFLTTAIIADGGQLSALYLLYFPAIMGSGMRFGTPMLIYTQTLSLFSFTSLCLFLWLHEAIALDWPYLFVQLLLLFFLPRYTQQANNHAHEAVNAKKDAESTAFQLLDKSPIAAFTFERDHHGQICISYVNQAMQHIYPHGLRTLIGFPVEQINLTEDGREILHACEAVFQPDSIHTDKPFYIRANGKQNRTLQLMGQARPLNSFNKTIGICFLTDITQNQDFNQKMQQNMQEGYMGTLVAGIVHDFRNILTSIIGTAEVMQFSQTNPATIHELNLIIQAGEHGTNMISNLLTLGKASDKEHIHDEADMVETLTSMLNLLRIQLPKSIDLNLHVHEPLPTVQISLTHLEQMLMNLIKNAAEATDQQGTIDVSLYPDTKPNPFGKAQHALSIRVADHGVGIAPENLANVTKAFWTSRKDSEGTGLGLAMVQRIVQQHHGLFHIDSKLGIGTTITLTFPVSDKEKPVAPPHLPTPASKQTPPASMQIWSILVVDDNDDVLRVHQHMLQRMGHHVVAASSGDDALKQMQSNKQGFDMVITDFMMPNMDGIDLCQRIRQHNPSIPLLMITAFGDSKKLNTADQLKVHLVYKPISFNKFEEQIFLIQQSLKVQK